MVGGALYLRVRCFSNYFKMLCNSANSAPLLADLFLHTFEFDFMLKTMKADMSEAVEFSTTFRYIDDLFSANKDNFGNSIREIYPSELELKDTALSSTEVCYLDTGDSSAPFHISVSSMTKEKTSTSGLLIFLSWTATSLPLRHMMFTYLNMVRYARICTAKADFMHRLRTLSSRLKQQGFKSTLLVKSVKKFFKRHCTTMIKYNVTLRELRSAVRD